MKHLRYILAAACCCSVLLTACGAPAEGEDGGKGMAMRENQENTETQEQSSESGVWKIAPEEAHRMMEQGGVIVVDVRTQEEYDEAHVPGAIVVPNETIGEEAPEQLPDKEAVLLVYCRSGKRSAEASAKLAGLGYEKIYDFGGIIDWPYETEEDK